MIRHISIAAREPERTAGALAELLRGRVLPFPGYPNSFMALAPDSHGSSIEVYPLGCELHPSPRGAEFRENPTPLPYTATHAALSVPTSQQEIEAITARAGWRARRVRRGPLDFIECWVEDRVMLELFPPELEIDWTDRVSLYGPGAA
jgi:hypothetical protein